MTSMGLCGVQSARALSPTLSARSKKAATSIRTRYLFLPVLPGEGDTARHQSATRTPGISRARQICPGRPPRSSSRRWLLRRALAPHVALPGTARLGDAVDRQPSRNLRSHLPPCQTSQAIARRGMAYLIHELLQSDLSRGTGLWLRSRPSPTS